MKKYRSGLFVLFVFSLSILSFNSCKKINESTTLGSDLIPPVDNINTFDTVLNVETYNGLFTDLEDSTRSSRGNVQFLGKITDDPIFGKTDATLYMQFIPSNIKNPFLDSLMLSGVDSVVLVLGVTNVYGDTTTPLAVEVRELSTANNFSADSSYLIRKDPNFNINLPIATHLVNPASLNDSVFPYKERAANQLRVRLPNAFGQRFLNYDTTDAYASDSSFLTYFKGFAISATSGNALIGINPLSSNTKLVFYYRRTENGKPDTVSSNFIFTYNGVLNYKYNAAVANYIKRDYSSSQFLSYLNNPSLFQDDLVFIQNTPGSFSKIKVPGLGALSNRIVHRAELVVEQVYDQNAGFFTPPQYLYLETLDSSGKYKNIPYDFEVGFSPSGAYNITNSGVVGMTGTKRSDGLGNTIHIWRVNVSRYIQNVVIGREKFSEFRLSSPYIIKSLVQFNNSRLGEGIVFVNDAYAVGRVRVGGGNHPTQRMRLRIIYSKI